MRSLAATSLSLALTAASVVAIGGCATQSVTSPSPAPAQFKPRAIATTFEVGGRIAARDTGDSKRGFSGAFTWSHTAANDVVELITPLGQLAARVTLSHGSATVEQADGQRTVTNEPERYIEQAMGITLPLSALPYWMQGAPVPGVARRSETDSAGRLSVLWQNGWQIRYGEYSGDASDARPAKLDLSQGSVEARILISEWKAQ